jgi:hypothetical protein
MTRTSKISKTKTLDLIIEKLSNENLFSLNRIVLIIKHYKRGYILSHYKWDYIFFF